MSEVCIISLLLFFFSSRRRHTRYWRDWSSDVCSSDLITMLQASNKINVIPPEAQAQVDCRLLPDQDRDAFLREFTGVVNDPAIKIELVIGFSAAVSSTETALYRSIVDVIKRNYPNASIAPAVSTGFTDSHWFRDLGIASYGF